MKPKYTQELFATAWSLMKPERRRFFEDSLAELRAGATRNREINMRRMQAAATDITPGKTLCVTIAGQPNPYAKKD